MMRICTHAFITDAQSREKYKREIFMARADRLSRVCVCSFMPLPIRVANTRPGEDWTSDAIESGLGAWSFEGGSYGSYTVAHRSGAKVNCCFSLFQSTNLCWICFLSTRHSVLFYIHTMYRPTVHCTLRFFFKVIDWRIRAIKEEPAMRLAS